MAAIPTSTDDLRSAAPLTHAQYATFDTPLPLALGGELPSVTVCYETYGTLQADRSNAILICHALSGDSHVTRHNRQDLPGWWEQMVGPGKPIDTNRFFVICSNVLGGCRGTTGPGAINPATGRPYGADFPAITIQDMVDVQARLMDHLGIEHLRAVIGGSLGGHQAMTWATHYPDRIGFCAAIATSPRLTSQALAFDVVARNAIQSDPNFHGGQYYDQKEKPDVGLAIARMLGHITYLSPAGMDAKFEPDRHNPREIQTAFEKRFSVGTYLAHQGDKFVERFDANSYVTISLAMDLFEMGRTPQELRQTLAPATCSWLLVSFSSDWLFPARQSCEIVDALVSQDKPVTYCEIPSDGGHDAFLLVNEISRYGQLIKAKLETDHSSPQLGQVPEHTNNVFLSGRLDYDLMLDLIEARTSVLDVGCGQGGLLRRLKDQCTERYLMGLEVSEPLLIAAVQQGLDVIDHDLNRGLPQFHDDQFDYVVLSQTLQAIENTVHVIEELVRVGRKAIVAFPNFAYKPLRAMLFYEGRSPRAEGEFQYAWYDTPNRRFPTIADFEELCEKKGIHILDTRFLDTASHRVVDPQDNPNLHANTAIFVIRR